MILNDYFSEIYCINLDRRPDRFHNAWRQFRKFGMYVQRYPAIDKQTLSHNGKISTGELGCGMSHYNIIKKCKENKSKNVLVFEDDVMLREDFLEIFNNTIGRVPEWDMLFFGGNHVGGLEQIDADIFKMRYSFCLHAYALRKHMFDVLLSNWGNFDKPVDVTTAELHERYNCYVIRPPNGALAWQKSNYSDIQEGERNYDFMK